ncbi:hypothetical protein ACFE04_019728 [Oxalis oulophora]
MKKEWYNLSFPSVCDISPAPVYSYAISITRTSPTMLSWLWFSELFIFLLDEESSEIPLLTQKEDIASSSGLSRTGMPNPEVELGKRKDSVLASESEAETVCGEGILITFTSGGIVYKYKIKKAAFMSALRGWDSQPSSQRASFSFQRWGLHQSLLSELFIAANSALACKAARQVELSRAGDGDAFLERANQKFHFEFRTSTSCCSWCFTISIGNERRSGGTCGTAYWITPVRHEAADAESAPMPLAMPCLVPRHGGGSGQKGEGCEGGLVIYTSGRMNGGPTDPGFHERWRVLECLSRALAHTPGLTERSSEGQPAHTASGEDGTTGKDRLAKTPQARSVVGLRRGNIAYGGKKGSPDGGRARGGRDLRMNAGLGHLEWREPHAGRPARTVFRGIWSKDRPAPTRLEGLRN